MEMTAERALSSFRIPLVSFGGVVSLRVGMAASVRAVCPEAWSRQAVFGEGLA